MLEAGSRQCEGSMTIHGTVRVAAEIRGGLRGSDVCHRALEKMIFKMSFNIKFTHQYNFCIWNDMQSFNLTPFSVMEAKVQKEE